MILPPAPEVWSLPILAVAWIVVTVCVSVLVGRLIIAEIDSFLGLAGVGAAIGLGFASAFPPAPGYGYLALTALVLAAVLSMPIAEKARRIEMRRIDSELVAGLYERLELNPRDVYASVRISEVLAHRGMFDRAVVLLQGVLKGQPVSLFAEEHRELARWRTLVSSNPQSVCLRCGYSDQVGVVICPRCGDRFLWRAVRGGALVAALVAPVVGISIVLTGLVVVPYLLAPDLALAVKLGGGFVALILLGVLGWRLLSRGLD